ncbi:MAG TPA: ATPase, T2SS/T4P/T4SS family [Mycobacteriales bacterium]|nr:ATPase, T2SS/T4P/T4SS family [Mycobacteriales bacterium]
MTTTADPGAGTGGITPTPPVQKSAGNLQTNPVDGATAQAGMLRAGIEAASSRHGLLGTRGIGAARRRIGEVLVEQGVIDADQLAEILAFQSSLPDPTRRPRLGRIVVERGLASERQVAQALASALGLPLVELNRASIGPDIARLLPKSVSDRHQVALVGREGDTLTLAMSDPTNVVALDDVRLYTRGAELSVVVAVESELRAVLGTVWHRTEDVEEVAAGLDSTGSTAGSDQEAELSTLDDLNEAPIVKLVEVLLADAVHQRASDVHIEPQQAEVRIRFRIDGLLRDVMTVPRSAGPAIISRLKIMSRLDIAERRKPQDGRARLTIDNEQVDARVSVLPSLYGEKVVIRLLARSADLKSLKDIGMEDAQLEELVNTLHQTQGLILITGPTGSGKTSTLYAGIHQIRSPERNIVTLEDPVEIALPGIVQVQINPKAGLTFTGGLRSILRQDPDVVLVGEIRDSETAALALEASMTGHLVLSTLHTNDAVAAVTRLVELGVDPFLIGSSLSLVIAQRLVRRPCDECSSPVSPTPRQLQLLGLTEEDLIGSATRRGKGCNVCGQTGYLGRVGVYEVLPVTAALRKVLLSDPSERSIAAAARAAGLRSLRAGAIAKALRGETTFEEVLRATPVETHEEGSARCPACSLRLHDDWLACPRCGCDVGGQICRGCARSLEEGWRVCPTCRTPVESSSYSGLSALVDVPDEDTKRRVLVVDEDDNVGAYLAKALADDLHVDSAATGDAALRLLSLESYDAVVLDLALPDLPGLEMVRIVREDPRTATVPLLLFTGAGDERLELEARTAGADDWLPKPAPPEELIRRLNALLGIRS